MNGLKLSGAGLLLSALVFATNALSSPVPLESPDEEECSEWKYPTEAACGNLSGKTECKARPTIEASDDDDKKEKCQPTKGDTCFCE